MSPYPTIQRPHQGNALLPLLMIAGIAVAAIGMGYLLKSLRAPPLPAWSSNSAQETQFVDALLSRMTLEEKIGQCNLATPAIDLSADRTALGVDPSRALDIFQLSATQREDLRRGHIGGFIGAAGGDFVRTAQAEVAQSRLGIPLLFGAEVLHGYATIFPSPLAEVASWSPTLAERTARAAAREATAVGINWTLAPAVDVARDARWKRIGESAGEDVLLASQFTIARVRGFQGEALDSTDTIAATARHFIADGAAEGGLDYAATDLSEHTMRSVYLPPFQAAINSGVATIMTSFNDINGMPGTAHKSYLIDLLKGELGFSGFVIARPQAGAKSLSHDTTIDPYEAIQRTYAAGVDIRLGTMPCGEQLRTWNQGKPLEKQYIDDATRRILSVKYQLGLFDNPLRYAKKQPKKELLSTAARQLARTAGRESIVLLKNEGGLLPLAKRGQRLALIGPFIKDKQHLNGSWLPLHRRSAGVSLYEGLVAARGGENGLLYTQGSGITTPLTDGIAAAVREARRADVAVLALGTVSKQPKDAAIRTRLRLPDAQLALARAVIATGVPVVVLLRNSGPLALPWLAEHANAIVETWFLGSETGNAVADILFGDYAPSGRLPVSFPRYAEQEPLYYNHKNSGQPSAALFPFGHGLSYTSFRYEAIELDNWLVPPQEDLKVTVTVRNTGQRDGETVAQLYLHDSVASSTRPVRELKAYQRQHIKAGETAQIEFTVPESALRLVNNQQQWVSEPGRFDVFVGANSVTGLQTHFHSIQQRDATEALPLRVGWDGANNGLERALSQATATKQHDISELVALYHQYRAVIQGAIPPSSVTLTVSITTGSRSIAEGGGELWLQLFADHSAWENGVATAYRLLPPSEGTVVTTFPGLTPGDYALQLFDDLNGDAKLNVDALGLPTEPVTFSNSAKYTLHGAPDFQAVRVRLSPGTLSLSLPHP